MRFLKNAQENDLQVAITPLIDIIFLLIIFFLVSSTFQNDERDLSIQLPETEGGKAAERDPEIEDLFFNIRKDKTIVLNGEEKSFAEIEAILKERSEEPDRSNLVVRSDKKVEYEIFAKLLGMIKKYGFSHLSIQTLQPSKS